MAQVLPRYCPHCGAEMIPDQHFCARCGLQFSPDPPNYPLSPGSAHASPQQDFPSPQYPVSPARGFPPHSEGILPPGPANWPSGSGIPPIQGVPPMPGFPPSRQSNVPSSQGIMPPAQGNMPSQPGIVPPAQGFLPPSAGNIPSGPGVMPSQPANSPSGPAMPSMPGFLPSRQNNVPSAQGIMPPEQGNAFSNQGVVPPPQGNMPWGPGNVAPGQGFSPLAQGILPSAQGVVPTAQNSTPPHRAGQPSGKRRLAIVLVLVLLLALVGTAGYFGLHFLGFGKLTQASITTTSLNSTITYAGVDVTLLNAQQSQDFIDDPATATDGMLRLHLQAQNKSTVPANLVYNNVAHLILPGGKELAPSYVKAPIAVAAGAMQTGVIDFVVPGDTKLNQITLRLGASNEDQMDIPLTSNPDLTRYTPKTVNLNNKDLQYLGLDWHLVSATSQFSIPGQQASKGMRFVTLTLSVDNTLMQTAIPGSAYDYARLKASNTTAVPSDATLPVSFDPGVNGKAGTVTFLVPQDVTALTFILASPQKQEGFNPATASFQA